MKDVRKAAVASMFYPDDTINLKRMINNFLSNVPPEETTEYFKKNSIDNILGIIVPHAGYYYSGQVAAYGYSLIKQRSYDTVIIIGPSHFNAFDGFALSTYSAFETPLGEIEVDIDFTDKLIKTGKGVFDFYNTAHIKEHSLEVQMPFLKNILADGFKIVPLLMGEQTLKYASECADILSEILNDYEKHYLIVISSDLSHYHNSEEANNMDKDLIKILDKMDSKTIMEKTRAGEIEACGAGPISVILELAKRLKRENVKTLIYKNSGDVSGDTDRVVGYLSAAVW